MRIKVTATMFVLVSVHIIVTSTLRTDDGRFNRTSKSNRVKYITNYYGEDPSGAELITWNDTSNRFNFYNSKNTSIMTVMKSAGELNGKDSGDIVLLVQDFSNEACFIDKAVSDNTYYHTEYVMKQLLRMHTKMTPNVLVVLVDWSKQVASVCRIRNTHAHEAWRVSAYYAVRATMIEFLKTLGTFRVHCVGMSVGSSACASFARHYESYHSKKFERIVAMDPPTASFSDYKEVASPNSLTSLFNPVGGDEVTIRNDNRDYMLHVDDAKYVVVIASSEGGYGPYGPMGDEYIRSDLTGKTHEACHEANWWKGKICATSYSGMKYCEDINIPFHFHRTRALCSHICSLLTFIKGLDVFSTFPAMDVRDKSLSSWNAYTTSKDYTKTASFYSPTTLPESIRLNNHDMQTFSVLFIVSRWREAYLDTYDDYYSKEEGELHYRWYFIAHIPNPLVIYTKGTPILIRVYKGSAAMDDRPTINSMAMTGLKARETICYHTHTYIFTGTKKYDCYLTGGSIKEPHYRTQMNVTAKAPMVIPPKEGCLPFDVVFQKNVIFLHTDLKAEVGSSISLSDIVQRNPDLQAITCEMNREITTVMTFWNKCTNYYYPLDIEYDRSTKTINVSMSRVGGATLRLYFQWKMAIVRISFTKKKSGQK
ncbi:lipase [Spheniscid alphaherpesvirus 1]|uniref:Lipase n=1 Tax=Spheniscid alphaherpesvirus 1 TaxID=2560777 RepID=A0A1R3T475_9ALPH|nr:lipase [Spheniscid alphaherpesvirus 1]SCO83619.1 lipase [Spheniscid alphaherpesvirus 1]